MKSTSFPGCRLWALAFMAGVGLASASVVSSVPEGSMNFAMPAGNAISPSVSTFSIPLNAAVPSNFNGKPAGALTSVTDTTLTDTTAGWTAGALSHAVSPFFIRLTSGAAEGRTLLISTTAGQQNTATKLTVDNQGTPLTTQGILAGDTYQIFPADTLFSLFGSDVLGGTSTANADVVRLNAAGTWTEYYYNPAVTQWRTNASTTSQNNVVIRPDSGIIFYRRGTTAIVLTITGRVPSTDLQLAVNETGSTFVAGFPMDTLLGQSDYSAMPGWTSTTSSIVTSDKLDVFENGAWYSYNFNQAAGQWRDGSIPIDEGSQVNLPAGIPVIVESSSGTPGVKIWKRIMPYTL